jgi:hypothetical protein
LVDQVAGRVAIEPDVVVGIESGEIDLTFTLIALAGALELAPAELLQPAARDLSAWRRASH